MTTDQTAAAFTAAILAERSEEQRIAYRRFFPDRVGELGVGEHFVGVRMGTIFQLAKRYRAMTPIELEIMLADGRHEVRVGACKAMALQAAANSTSEQRRRELYELYLRRHDRINNWDLVDLAAGPVVGGWLIDKPRDKLYELAAAPDMWRRRTAVVATIPFVSTGDLADTYTLAERLGSDPEETVQKAVGWLLRYAGDKDQASLLSFLDAHRDELGRIAHRAAIEKLPRDVRARFR